VHGLLSSLNNHVKDEKMQSITSKLAVLGLPNTGASKTKKGIHTKTAEFQHAFKIPRKVVQ